MLRGPSGYSQAAAASCAISSGRPPRAGAPCRRRFRDGGYVRGRSRLCLYPPRRRPSGRLIKAAAREASGAGIVCSVDDDAQLDPETQRLLDDAWDALDDGDLKAAARGLVAAP